MSIEKESVLLEEKEAERASLLEEHEELDNERKELVEERAEVRANANQKASAAINSRSMAEDIANSLAVREQNLAELLIEMAAESIDVAEEDADLPNVGDAQKIVNNLRRKLDKFGDFNMLAIEQYDACKARLDEMKDDFKPCKKEERG